MDIDSWVRKAASVRGWLTREDIAALHIAQAVQQQGVPGDILEIGVYEGKSAIVLGSFLAPSEKFIAADLFGGDPLIRGEHASSLFRAPVDVFLRNWNAHHGRSPEIIQGDSALIGDRLTPASCRLVHIDGGHLEEQVRIDLETALRLLRPGGMVVLDDYRMFHTPGVAYAVWEAVRRNVLSPVWLTAVKLYAVRPGDEQPYIEGGRRLASAHGLVGEDVLLNGKTSLLLSPLSSPEPATNRWLTDLMPPALLRLGRRALGSLG